MLLHNFLKQPEINTAAIERKILAPAGTLHNFLNTGKISDKYIKPLFVQCLRLGFEPYGYTTDKISSLLHIGTEKADCIFLTKKTPVQITTFEKKEVTEYLTLRDLEQIKNLLF